MLAVMPRITGGCRPDCPDAWKVKPGVIRATPSRLSMPAASRSSPSNAETLAGTLSSDCARLSTVTMTVGSSAISRAYAEALPNPSANTVAIMRCHAVDSITDPPKLCIDKYYG